MSPPPVLLLVSLLAAQDGGVPAAARVTATELMTRAIRAQAQWERFRGAGGGTWRVRTETEQLDDDAKVSSTETRESEVVRVEGRPFARLVRQDGRSLTGAESAKEAREEKEFAARVIRAREKGGKFPDDEERFVFTPDLAERFRWERAGPAQRAGRACELVRFFPKDRDFPVLNPRDRVVNRLSGEICVDPEAGAIVELRAGLEKPVDIGWVVGKVSALSMTYRQVPVDAQTWGPGYFEMHVKARALLKKWHRRTRVTWWDHRGR